MSDRKNQDRRKSQDRRTTGDRRNDGRRLAIEIRRSTLQAAVFIPGSGNQSDRLLTRILRWRSDASGATNQLPQEELTQTLKQLVAEERLTGVPTRIALHGDLCVTRIVNGVTTEVRQQLTELEERSQLYLTLGPGTKIVAEAVRPLDARHSVASLSVANESVIQVLTDACEGAGLKLERIESSLIAAARMMGAQAPSLDDVHLVAALDEGGLEIGLCQKGQLLLDYRPAGNAANSSIAKIMTQHLPRLERFCQRQLHLTKTQLKEIFCTGPEEMVQLASQELKTSKVLMVQSLSPNLEGLEWNPENHTPSEMFVAIGCLLPDITQEHYSDSPNLMDQVLASKREPLKPILLRMSIPIAAMLAMVMGMTGFNWHRATQLEEMRQALDALSTAQAKAKELELQFTSSSAKFDELTKLAKKLPPSRLKLTLDRIRTNLPEDVYLERLQLVEDRSATVVGASHAESSIYDFAEYLEAVPEVDEVALQGTGVAQTATGMATSFDLNFTLIDPLGISPKE